MQQAPNNIAPPKQAHPSRLYIEPTTQCNLSCAMCVKQSAGNCIVEGDISWKTFARIKPAFGHAQSLVISGIGEPLVHPGLEEMIAVAKADMPPNSWVGMQSNGHLLSPQRAQSLAHAGLDKICLSVDAVDPAMLSRLRGGGTLSGLERAFNNLQPLLGSNGGLKAGVEFVLMRDNLTQLPEVIQWAAHQGASFALVSQMLPYEEDLVDQVLYGGHTDASLALFEKWHAKAARAGVDLMVYLEHYHRYQPTPDMRKAVWYVSQLKAEAREQEIPIDIISLLKGDASQAALAGEVLEHAAEVARAEGLDLTLPALVPEKKRRCPFVEDGGIFVAWDGLVYPCHYLWHRYWCFLGGRKKYVDPIAFGDLADMGILDIWRDPVYDQYRDEVLLYDYPYCTNCPVAPCDFINAETFTSDCYTIEVPCGDCPWCQGLLHCLQ